MGRALEYRELKPEALRHVLTTLVERVELDPKTRDFDIKYRLPITGVKGASPRGFEPRSAPSKGDSLLRGAHAAAHCRFQSRRIFGVGVIAGQIDRFSDFNFDIRSVNTRRARDGCP